jgi:hypothetical protein
VTGTAGREGLPDAAGPAASGDAAGAETGRRGATVSRVDGAGPNRYWIWKPAVLEMADTPEGAEAFRVTNAV